MSDMFKMPDGTYTADVVKQAKAWDEIAMVLAEAMGVQIIGFDPDYVFQGGTRISREAGFRLYNVLKGKEQ